jgi:hypothetical protein
MRGVWLKLFIGAVMSARSPYLVIVDITGGFLEC